MMELIDRAAYSADMRERQEACKICIDNAADEADRERWRSAYGVFVEAKLTLDKQPTIEAVPLGPLCEWLAGYAEPPKYAMDIIPDSGKCLVNARAKAWEHHFRTMMECGLMEEGEHEHKSTGGV